MISERIVPKCQSTMFACTFFANASVHPNSFWNHAIDSGFFFCQFSKTFAISAFRSASGVFIHGKKAALAALTAWSMSCALPSGTLAQTWAVFESVTSRYLPGLLDATQAPLTY